MFRGTKHPRAAKIRSRDRHVPRRRPRDARSRARRFSNAQYVDLGEIREIRAARKKKKRRSATPRKDFLARAIGSRTLRDSRDRRREVRARSMIDDARRARSRDRSIARARGRPRARGLSEPARARAGDDDARGARASASAGASARGGVRCEKIRARRRRGAGGETRSATARGRWRFIHPSRHPAIQTSIAARRARRGAWAWCRDIDRRARRR